MTVSNPAVASGRLMLPRYESAAGVHPPLDSPEYRSSALRHPKHPLIPLPQRLTEITGPLFGAERVGEHDADLTAGHAGEPIGERIIVSGRVLDSDGRPVPDATGRQLRAAAGRARGGAVAGHLGARLGDAAGRLPVMVRDERRRVAGGRVGAEHGAAAVPPLRLAAL